MLGMNMVFYPDRPRYHREIDIGGDLGVTQGGTYATEFDCSSNKRSTVNTDN